MANPINQLLGDTLALVQAMAVLVLSNDDPSNVAAVVAEAEQLLADLPVSPSAAWLKTVLPKATQDWLFTLAVNRIAQMIIKTGFFKVGGGT